MKILMITVFPPIAVAEADHALHLCEHLADYGAEMHVVAQEGCVSLSHPRIRIYSLMRNWSWAELPTLVRATMRCSPDAVILIYHGWIYPNHPMLTFAPAVLRTLRPDVHFVTLFEDAWGCDLSKTSLLSRAIRKALKQCFGEKGVDYEYGTLLRDSNRLIVVSDHTRATLAERFSGVNCKSVLIPCPPIMRIVPEDDGTARRLKRTALGLKDDEFLIAYFGRICPGKGLETLLKAFQTVSVQRRAVRLILIGGYGYPFQPSYYQGLQAMPKELGIEDKVMWTGEYAWDSEDASRCLRAADFCVLPFDLGVCVHNSSLAGACAHGLPIITTSGTLTESVFIHKENVFLCPPKDPRALAQAMETLMARPELRRHLSVGARGLAQESFSWEKATECTIGALTREISETTC